MYSNPVEFTFNDESLIDSPWLTQCSEDGDYFNTLNHEIDIELPANSPQYAQSFKDWVKHCDWNTWNANTWIADNNHYDGTTVWYTQAEAKTCAPGDGTTCSVRCKKLDNSTGQCIIMEQKSNPLERPSFVSENGEYHDYVIDWYADEDTSKNYVKFYFGEDLDINNLKDENLIYTTNRFVPTRAGRLVIGMWPSWWGCGRVSPQYDLGYLDISKIHIVPYVPKGAADELGINSVLPKLDIYGNPFTNPVPKLRSWPNTFDQIIPCGNGKREIKCGFIEFGNRTLDPIKCGCGDCKGKTCDLFLSEDTCLRRDKGGNYGTWCEFIGSKNIEWECWNGCNYKDNNGDLQRYSGCRDRDYAGCPINIPNNNDKICGNIMNKHLMNVLILVLH